MYALRIQNSSGSDRHSCETTKTVAKKAQSYYQQGFMAQLVKHRTGFTEVISNHTHKVMLTPTPSPSLHPPPPQPPTSTTHPNHPSTSPHLTSPPPSTPSTTHPDCPSTSPPLPSTLYPSTTHPQNSSKQTHTFWI